MSEKIKELAAVYNTWGYDSGVSRMAEAVLVHNNAAQIEEARVLAAMAKQVN